MATKLIGQNYTTPDIVAKVTGKAKYAEDIRAEGMLFAKLLLSPMPHARVLSIDTSAALAMPGVKAILTADDLAWRAGGASARRGRRRRRASASAPLTMEPLYEGEPILAVAAVDELTAAEAIEAIQIEFEPLPFVVDPLVSLRPGGPNARLQGNMWTAPAPQAAAGARGGAPAAGAAAGGAAAPAAGAPAAARAPAARQRRQLRVQLHRLRKVHVAARARAARQRPAQPARAVPQRARRVRRPRGRRAWP